MAWIVRFSIFSFLLVTFSATPTTEKFARKYMIVWNVGQGQWVTSVEEFSCRHFDVGGERFPWKKIATLCRDKKNFIYLSHWDWDHIGGLARWPSSWDTCIAMPPLGQSSAGKMKMLARFAKCEDTRIKKWKEINPPQLGKRKRPDTNALSQVVQYKGVLFTGDSPVKAESEWSNQEWVPSSRVLILGHHGSRTSTSEHLLDRTRNLNVAIASARYARYKHPHAEVVARIKRHRIPLLKTEDWGNIWLD
ncbi:ComEC/Rec2 family competence protein [Bdellovibrio sp. HCB209]|uniref:ComEC/Rec2 family competence protein n=1 Tax=Bdellovibrio sp. HCB209 TaxID=3394354 RepID=UPI0039B62067